MRERTRSTYSDASKAKLAMVSVKCEHTLAELGQQFDVYSNQITE